MHVILHEAVVMDCDIDIELELRILATVKSYQARVKSMDRLLKRYGEAWRRQLEVIREEGLTGRPTVNANTNYRNRTGR